MPGAAPVPPAALFLSGAVGRALPARSCPALPAQGRPHHSAPREVLAPMVPGHPPHLAKTHVNVYFLSALIFALCFTLNN